MCSTGKRPPRHGLSKNRVHPQARLDQSLWLPHRRRPNGVAYKVTARRHWHANESRAGKKTGTRWAGLLVQTGGVASRLGADA